MPARRLRLRANTPTRNPPAGYKDLYLQEDGDVVVRGQDGTETPLGGTDEQTIRLLGPYHVAHDTASITTGISLATLTDGQLVLDIRTFITEEWAASASLEYGLGEISDPTDYVSLGQTPTLDNQSAPVTAGVVAVPDTSEGVAWGFATGTRRALTVLATDSVATGEADIYALIAEPSA